MLNFFCDCGNRLFFENSECLHCNREVGWCPACWTLTAMRTSNQGTHCVRCDSLVMQCANRVEFDVCNRNVLVPPDGDQETPRLCDCCRYNETIPDLSVPGNLEHWLALEQAKRRLFFGLDSLGLPHGATADGFDPGLSFDFKGDTITRKGLWRRVHTQEPVYTGHAGGKITINIREADAVEREKLRVDLEEGHRTLIGHFRHEIGHYYWDLLVAGHAENLRRFHELFGDHENPSYSDALERHYNEGPPADWRSSFISSYATMHPWEDWAETFAFYLDVVDVMETATSYGLVPDDAPDDLDDLLEAYAGLGILLNELNRGMGLIDFLPELIVPGVVPKIRFVHDVIRDAAQTAEPADTPMTQLPG
ncbi:MAG: putative zinc-binding metallopeptidase [Rhodospirillales bacterium]